jgi:hypothetical protein
LHIQARRARRRPARGRRENGVSERSSAPEPTSDEPDGIALGAEKIGLIPLYAPILSLLVVLALSVVAAFGIARIKVDDSLSQLFRSDSAEFQQYESLSQRFPSSEYDVLVVVEGKQLLQRSQLEQIAVLCP